MSAETLLTRLEDVRQTASDRWIARCPAHADRRPSLSVRETADGRMLIHCFGGCESLTVLHAVGLHMSDLFPGGALTHHARPTRSRIPAADLLAMIDEDVTLVGIIGTQMLEKRSITESEWTALADAVARIGRAHAQVAA